MDDTTKKTFRNLYVGLQESAKGIKREVNADNPHPEVLRRFAIQILHHGSAILSLAVLLCPAPKPNS